MLTATTWRNLTKVYDLINEICKWASSRLADKRWSLAVMSNKITIKEEIIQFKAQIADAREIFQDRTFISLSGSIDAVLQVPRRLFGRQDRIMLTLESIQAIQRAQYTRIIDNLEAKERQQYVTQMFSQHAITNVHQGKPLCDISTRIEIVADIMN